MKRSTFLFISALIAWAFGLVMMLNPSGFTSGTIPTPTPQVDAMMRIVGVNLFAFGWINFLARNDGWTKALRAVLIGNILLHVLGLAFDGYNYAQGLFLMSGVMMGAVVHLLFIFGFSVYAFRKSARETSVANAST
jgi:hypothetical protein